ncbi:glycerate 2-kinase [Sulfolobus acidocaldarius]|uniref:MOFRL family protein n=4 Tax=Sulfolobus acidocaldarius TaxID=2285 RepID=Q4JCE1_SULAC|nr:glycerate 2-kinase [Sulfolobus acidocaldarius]AAY79538.1 MOFRL family protein [Sulfolobus acidocaldarius DSM 639]ALU30583.1 glycerate kinase [Sulfolobus acidocaldarius]ALU32844.1 glycerate kinase [Sulfolobus acidocaldarius]
METDIVKTILSYSDSYLALSRKVEVNGNKIRINGVDYEFQNPLLISIGKSSPKMAKFFVERLKVSRGLIVSPYQAKVDSLEVIVSSHPKITEKSLYAGSRIVDMLRREDYDIVIFLLSGGASALVEYSDVPLEVLKEINDKLVTSGLSIDEINTVRKHLSKIKGGWLAKYSKAPIVSLIISDVPSSDISFVGSGPTILDKTSVIDAERILAKIGLSSYNKYLVETPKDIKNTVNVKILDVEEVLVKLKNHLKNSLLLSSEVKGDAYSFGVNLAGIANTFARINRQENVILAGGEPDVKITSKAGKGGRNGEVCLGFLKYIRANAKLYAVATDGIDGNSEYAGCYVDHNVKIENIDYYVESHSSYEILEKTGNVIQTGFTGDNVNNIYVLHINN